MLPAPPLAALLEPEAPPLLTFPPEELDVPVLPPTEPEELLPVSPPLEDEDAAPEVAPPEEDPSTEEPPAEDPPSETLPPDVLPLLPGFPEDVVLSSVPLLGHAATPRARPARSNTRTVGDFMNASDGRGPRGAATTQRTERYRQKQKRARSRWRHHHHRHQNLRRCPGA